MAGSYNHATLKKSGKLRNPRSLNAMVETGGDTYEMAEEMYGMIWYLAERLKDELSEQPIDITTRGLVEEARENYKQGIEVSPGIQKSKEK
jgi:hypothetical protein